MDAIDNVKGELAQQRADHVLSETACDAAGMPLQAWIGRLVAMSKVPYGSELTPSPAS